MKKAICILMAIILIVLIVPATVSGETLYTYAGYTYAHLDNGMASIRGWDDSSADFVVPDQVAGIYVYEVGRNSMQKDETITSVDFSEASRLNVIGGYAFESCSSLSGTLALPRRIGFIGDTAFMNCSSIQALDYQANTYTIPRQCFRNCYSLSEVRIAEGPTSIEAYAFQNCGALASVTLPRSIVSINSTAFSNCGNFTIYCYSDSYALQYAQEKGYDYVLLDPPVPTEPPTEEPTVVPTEEPTNPATPDQPIPEPTELPTEAIVPILGDADGNGEVDLIDATLIQRLLAEIQVIIPIDVLMYGDVDGDGELTISDVTFIQRYEAEMDSIYPIGQPIE